MSEEERAASATAFERLRQLSPERRERLLAGLTGAERHELDTRWAAWAHDNQRPPDGDGWRVWLMRAGRGFGKTRAGAEWISGFARDHPDARIALVGSTHDDAVSIMVRGVSGLLAVAQVDERPVWRAHAREVPFPSGAVATV